MGNFYRVFPQLRCILYKASLIDNEVGWPKVLRIVLKALGWPAFATEKGSSRAKHKVGCELTSVARQCSRQTTVLAKISQKKVLLVFTFENYDFLFIFPSLNSNQPLICLTAMNVFKPDFDELRVQNLFTKIFSGNQNNKMR